METKRSANRAIQAIEPLEQRIAPATFLVTNTGDRGAGSLRDAIDAANIAKGADLIQFEIGGPGPHVIPVTGSLPTITDPLFIDGYTQPGASRNTLDVGNNATLQIWIEGSDAGAANGLVLGPGSDGSKIAGLVIIDFRADGFGGNGIQIESSNNTIEGNWIGTDGRAPLINAAAGVNVVSGTKNIIGGLAPSARNVVSGNSTGIALGKDAIGTTIAGNYIGTDPSGIGSIPNTEGISIQGASGTLVGAAAPGGGNLISGNARVGIIDNGGIQTTVRGNVIGLASDGKTALANGDGILLSATKLAQIGGIAAGEGNVISGNGSSGITVSSASDTAVQGNLIGVDRAGATAIGNRGLGVRITNSTETVVGGTVTGARNIISGNGDPRSFDIHIGVGVLIEGESATDNVVAGNYIGTDASGTVALGNTKAGIAIYDAAHRNVIGGVGASSRNVISGNQSHGIDMAFGVFSNSILSNYVGTDATGTRALGNAFTGVHLNFDASANSIGGSALEWSTSAGGNGHYYLLTSRASSWSQAEAEAVAAGGHLVSIGSAAEQAFLAQAFLSSDAINQTFWLGFNDAATEGSFVWSDGSPVTYTNFHTGEPNDLNGNEDYAVINWHSSHESGPRGDWNDVPVTGLASDLRSPEPYFGIIEFNAPPQLGNVISGNNGDGVRISEGSGGNRVAGNFIGTDATGRVALGNVGGNGVVIESASDNIIGGMTAAERNVIAGNVVRDGVGGYGVRLTGDDADFNFVQGNYIGVDVSGRTAIRVVDRGGIVVEGNLHDNVIGGSEPGAGNVIITEGDGIDLLSLDGPEPSRTIIEGNRIGADAAGFFATGSGNAAVGIFVEAAIETTIRGNLIAGNQFEGILLTTGSLGTGVHGNVIVQNNDTGVDIEGATATVVQGNLIGTDATGTDLGNAGEGIYVQNSTVTIGGVTRAAGNVIAFNKAAGVLVHNSAFGVAIRGNSIFNNNGLGVDLDPAGLTANDTGDGDRGANELQNFPVLTTATGTSSGASIAGDLNSRPGGTFQIDLYASPVADPTGFGEGKTYLGSTAVTADANGNASFTFNGSVVVAPGSRITATATDATGNTSEFSAAVPITLSSLTFVWDSGGGADQSWFNPLNWDRDNGFPGAIDTAILGNGGTIQLPSDASVANFQQQNGMLQSGPGITFSVLTAFDWSGGVQGGPGITLLPAGSALTLSSNAAKVLDARTLDSAAAVTWTAGRLVGDNGGSFHNRAAGIVDLQFDGQIGTNVGTPLTFINDGLFKKSGGTGTGSVDAALFENNGRVDVQSGLLQFVRAVDASGTFTATAGAQIIFLGATQLDSATLAGAGSKLLRGATTVSGTLTATNAELFSGTFTGSATLVGDLTWTSAVLTAPGALQVAPGSILTLTGAGAKTIDGYTIDNRGTVTWKDGNILGNNGAVFRNELNAFFEIQSDAAIRGGGIGAAPSFSNSGKLLKTGGTGTMDFATESLANSGAVEVSSGGIFFRNAVTGGGAFAAGPGTTMTFAGATTLDGANLTGPGLKELTGVTMVSGTLGAQNVTLRDATVTGTAMLSGDLHWIAATFTGPGTLTIPNGSSVTIDGPGVKALDGYGLRNAGILTWGAGDLLAGNGATIENQSGGTFAITADGLIRANTGTALTLNNAGTLTKSGGTGNTVINAVNVTNSGTIEAKTGTLHFAAPFTQSAGAILLLGGNVGSSLGLRIDGGSLVGAGNVTGDVTTNGIVRPGNNLGILNVTGNFTLGFNGLVAVEIGGTAPGNQYDRLAVQGTMSFAGTFNATRVNGFTPAPGDRFDVVTYGSHTGTFAVLTGDVAGLTAAYTPTSFSLQAPDAPTTVVDTELDVIDANDGLTSLREAITFANSTPGTDAISFNIPGIGVHRIILGSELPAITESVIIDGYTQPGSSQNERRIGNDANLRIELYGGQAGAGADGLTLSLGASTIRGLVINGFGGSGIVLERGAAGNLITGNFIGTDATGSFAIANGSSGIDILDASSNRIGGNTAAERNLISGNGNDAIFISGANADGNIIEGNYLGTNAAGTVAIPNDNDAIFITNGADSTVVGGGSLGDGNLISGNNGYGVSMSGFSLPTITNAVLGNLIGTDANGTLPIPNSDGGISIFSSSNNTIGLATGLGGNLIAFNGGNGIDIFNGDANGDSKVNAIVGNRILQNEFHGVFIGGGAHDNVIGGVTPGESNEIALNGADGIALEADARGIRIIGNSIHDNAAHGIDLNDDGATANDPGDSDTGGNDLLNHPVITAVIASAGGGQNISGTINSLPNTTLRIELFRADASTLEGQTFVGFTTVTTDALGNGTFTVFASGNFAAGTYLTATATDENAGGAGTSEFGAPFQVGGLPPGARLNISDVAIAEGQSGTRNALFTVTLSEVATQTVTVDFRTLDLTAHAADNDYVPVTGTLTFAPGQLLATISVPVNGDTLGEARERFVVELSNALNANLEDAQGTGVIRDDDHHLLVTGSSKGSLVRVFDATSGKMTASFEAFEPSYRGGVRVATGDVNGDGVNDIIAGGGTASGGRVRVFDGVSFEPLSGVLGDFDAFGRFYRGGVFVAAGDVDGDGRAEVIVSPSAGSSGEVRVFSGIDGSELSRFTAFGKGSGGVRVAAGDVNGDGRAEVIAGAGLGSTVRIFDAMAGLLLDSESAGGGQNELRTFGRKFRGGVYVAAGDVNGDGLDDVIAGAASDQRTFRVFTSPLDEDAFTVHDAYAGALRGVRVSTVDVNSDGIADIVAGKARGDAKVTIFEGASLERLLSLSGYPTRGDGSVFVG